jgi:hypothetical protein
MGVRVAFIIAAVVAVAIAMLLPVPGKGRSEARTSQIETVAVGQG